MEDLPGEEKREKEPDEVRKINSLPSGSFWIPWED